MGLDIEPATIHLGIERRFPFPTDTVPCRAGVAPDVAAFTIQVAGERLRIPADTTFTIEHECAGGRVGVPDALACGRLITTHAL